MLLVTRPEPDASATVERLAALGLSAVAAPLFTLRPLPAPLPEGGFDAVAITSANALRALQGRLQPYLRLPLFAVGDRTAALARAEGFNTVTSADGGMARLAPLIAAHAPRRVLYLAGRDRTGDLAALLGPGVDTVLVEVYDMEPVPALPVAAEAMLTQGAIQAVLLYSVRAAERFVALTSPSMRRAMQALCLSSTIAEVARNAHFAGTVVANASSETAMMGLALRVCGDQKAQ